MISFNAYSYYDKDKGIINAIETVSIKIDSIQDSKLEIETYKGKIKKLESDIDDLKIEIDEGQREIVKLKSKIKDAEKRINQEILDIKRILSKFEDSTTLGRDLPGTRKSDAGLNNKIKELRNLNKFLANTADYLRESNQNCEREKRNLSESSRKYKLEIGKLHELNRECEMRLRNCDNKKNK